MVIRIWTWPPFWVLPKRQIGFAQLLPSPAECTEIQPVQITFNQPKDGPQLSFGPRRGPRITKVAGTEADRLEYLTSLLSASEAAEIVPVSFHQCRLHTSTRRGLVTIAKNDSMKSMRQATRAECICKVTLGYAKYSKHSHSSYCRSPIQGSKSDIEGEFRS